MLFCEMQYPKGRYCLQENALPWSKVCLDLSNSYIAAYLDLELFQMDVQTTFLSGKLNKEINMDEPIDFEAKERKKKIASLNYL